MSPGPNPSTDPFPFIVARGRSGTTLLRAMLDAHPDMAVPGESHFVVQFASRRSRYERDGTFDTRRFVPDLLDHFAFKRWGLPPDAVLEAFRDAPPADYPSAIRLLYATYAAHEGKSRFGDKTPSYVLNLDLLAETFPDAVFVHLIRDGRDVSLSYLDTDFGVSSLGQAAVYWDRFVRAGREAGSRLGATRYREIRYEDLIREPETVLREICAFIGLPFDPTMLAYHQQRADKLVSGIPASQLAHHQNIYKPPTTGLRDWRRDMSPRDVAVFEGIAGDLLTDLGYELSSSRPDVRTSVAVARSRLGAQFRRGAHAMHVRSRRLRKRLKRWAGRQGMEEQRHLSV